jgi:hypothetical protein
MFRLLTLLALGLGASTAFACGTPFDGESLAVTANKLLHAREFAKLDAMADKYRKQPGFTPAGQPALLDIYDGLSKMEDRCTGVDSTEAQWDQQATLLAAWRKAYPRSLTARIATGAYVHAKAWYVRGGGYASSVADQQWVDFAAGMKHARKLLETTVAATERDAGWYDAMLNIGLAQHWPAAAFDALSDTATRRYPDYLPLYVTSSYYHDKHWYGSDQEFKAYVDKVTERTRAAMGETLYTRLHHAGREEEMYESKTSWPRMKAGWERITQDYPVAHNRNNFASHACSNEDAAAMKEQFAKIGEQLIAKNFNGKDRMVYCQQLQHGPTQCFRRQDNGQLICEPKRMPNAG